VSGSREVAFGRHDGMRMAGEAIRLGVYDLEGVLRRLMAKPKLMSSEATPMVPGSGTDAGAAVTVIRMVVGDHSSLRMNELWDQRPGPAEASALPLMEKVLNCPR